MLLPGAGLSETRTPLLGRLGTPAWQRTSRTSNSDGLGNLPFVWRRLGSSTAPAKLQGHCYPDANDSLLDGTVENGRYMIASDDQVFNFGAVFVALYIGWFLAVIGKNWAAATGKGTYRGITLKNPRALRADTATLKSCRRMIVALIAVGLIGTLTTISTTISILSNIHRGPVDLTRLGIVIVELLWISITAFSIYLFFRLNKRLSALKGVMTADIP